MVVQASVSADPHRCDLRIKYLEHDASPRHRGASPSGTLTPHIRDETFATLRDGEDTSTGMVVWRKRPLRTFMQAGVRQPPLPSSPISIKNTTRIDALSRRSSKFGPRVGAQVALDRHLVMLATPFDNNTRPEFASLGLNITRHEAAA